MRRTLEVGGQQRLLEWALQLNQQNNCEGSQKQSLLSVYQTQYKYKIRCSRSKCKSLPRLLDADNQYRKLQAYHMFVREVVLLYLP